MADISITASSVLASVNAVIRRGTAGATITAGQPVYVDESDSNKIKLADCDASAATATIAGLALHGASSGQPISYCTEDLTGFTVGATCAIGDVLYLSPTAGGLTVTSGDILSGDYKVVVGVFTSTTVAKIRPIIGGVLA